MSTNITFKGTPDQVLAAIRDYERYPEFIPGVTKVEVLPAKKPGSTCQVRYSLKLIKTFQYTLDMFEEPGRVWWSLDSSNIMKTSDGSWMLVDTGKGCTRATYSLDVAFSGFVPQRVVDQVTKSSLPALIAGMQKLINAKSKDQK